MRLLLLALSILMLLGSAAHARHLSTRGLISISLVGNNCISSQCGFTPAAAVPVGTATAICRQGGCPSGVSYALKTNGSDLNGVACTNNSTLSINGGTGAITGATTTPGGITNGVCVTATQGGKSITQAFTIYSGFFVSTSGSGSVCTFAAPCALSAGSIPVPCQTSMQNSTTNKACFIRSGTYSPPSVTIDTDTYALYVTSNPALPQLSGSSDNGETWSYYPPDGVDNAIIDGGASSSTTGIKFGFAIEAASNITVNGLQFQHFAYGGIGSHGGQDFYSACYPRNWGTTGANNNTIINNIVHDTYGGGTGPTESSIPCGPSGIAVRLLAQNNIISNNVVYNTTGVGISADTGNAGETANISGLVYSNNVLYNNCSAFTDCGEVYMSDVNSVSSNITWKDNIVLGYSSHNAYYLDDGAQNVTATGNIALGAGTYAFIVHGGCCVTIKNNIVDAGNAQITCVLLAQPNGILTMSNEFFENNIIVWNQTSSPQQPYCTGNPQSFTWTVPTVQNNAYYNYSSGGVSTGANLSLYTPLYSDASPTTENPLFQTCPIGGATSWGYLIDPRSSVYNSPVSFPTNLQVGGWGTAGFWGPPGYVIPKTGVVPSYTPC